MNEDLKQKLGEEDYKTLMQTIARIKAEAHAAGLAEGKGYWVRTLVGIHRSRTGKVGGLVMAVGALYEFMPQVQELIPTSYYGAIISGLGALMIILRTITTKPLLDR